MTEMQGSDKQIIAQAKINIEHMPPPLQCINKGKSSVLLYNFRAGKPDEVGGMKVVSSIRYLGQMLGIVDCVLGSVKREK